MALADGIDIENDENDIMPFLNAMNDFYLKNISNRVKSAFAVKAKANLKLTGTAPYGFMRDPKDKTRLVVNEYAAGVVWRIFSMRAGGMVYGKITGALNSEDISPPRPTIISGKTERLLTNAPNAVSYTLSQICWGMSITWGIRCRSSTAGRTGWQDTPERLGRTADNPEYAHANH